MRYTKCQFLSKLIKENCWLAILFVISLVIILLCIFKPIYVDWTTSQINTINDVLLAISTGYASGYIIYILSVLVPKALRMIPILFITKENIRYARDEISAFFLNHGGPAEIDKKKVIELVSFFTKEEEHDFYYLEKSICEKLHEHIAKAMDYMQLVISQADYLDVSDIKSIKTIMKVENNLESRLRDRMDTIKEIESMELKQETKDEKSSNSQVYHKNEIVKIVKDIQVAYTTLDEIYKKYEEVEL